MTNIYASYEEFLHRENRADNGVSQEFADNNPTWREMNETNKACWNCRSCSDCSSCRYCSSCSSCSSCSDCSSCRYCSSCSDCSDKKDTEGAISVPVIENIHQKVLQAVQNEGALEMGDWHTCDTTHCRAGWVVTLAGEEGKKLEDETDTCFAAMQIYKASSSIRVSPVRYFEDNETAMKDIVRCAEEERKEVEGR